MITPSPELPYPRHALAPHISERTLELHFDRHHRGYWKKLRDLLPGTPAEDLDLVELITRADGAVLQNAAQVWNHDFYWHSMAPGREDGPRGRLAIEIDAEFGSVSAFEGRFTEAAAGLFGSGYVWLTIDPERRELAIRAMKDADNPMQLGLVPLLCMDVWEHAYYLDYQNERKRYAETFLAHLVCWEFAHENLEKAV
jgi:Fe-Mn family superoxide dismutase